MSTQRGSDQELNTRLNNLKLLQDGLQSATAYMRRQNIYDDVAIFVGSTKSGKSTLINYLIGNKLMGEDVIELLGEVSIKKGDNSPGPSIGNKSTSETIYPTKWKSRLVHELPIWDVPGFDDNRGIVQDITNAFYVYELFQNLKSAKIVLVTDINDIVRHNTRPFVTLLNAVEDILKEKIETCSDGIALIFTKVPQKIFQVPNFKEKIMKQYLENKFLLSGIDISPGAKNLIRNIINAGKIGFFKEPPPTAINQYITGNIIDEGIFEAIQNTKGINEQILKHVSPSISERSTIFLYEVREQLCSTKIFEELQNLLEQIIARNIPDSMAINKTDLRQNLLQHSQNLENAKTKLNKATDTSINRFDKKIDAIRGIDPAVENFIDKQNLLSKATYMEFIDRLLAFKHSRDLEINLQIVLTTAKSKIQESLICVKLKIQEISAAEAQAQSSMIQQQMKKENEMFRREKEAVRSHNEASIKRLEEKMRNMMQEHEQRSATYQRCIDELKFDLGRRRCPTCGGFHN